MRKRLLRTAAALAAAAVIVLLAAPELVAPHDPDAIDIANSLAPAGSPGHLLGTDHLGRDTLSRLIRGAGTSLGAVLAVAALSVAAGGAAGGAAGWFGGRADAALMRLCDVVQSFPSFILALFLAGMFGRGFMSVVLALTLTHWAWHARVARNMTLTLKSRASTAAARVAGGTGPGIFLRHLVPAILPQLLVLGAMHLGHLLLHVSALSFLGLGVQPPEAEWGVMIHDARAQLWTRPALIVLPGAAIFLTALAAAVAADALGNRVDPAFASRAAGGPEADGTTGCTGK